MRIIYSINSARKLESELCVKLGFCSMNEKYEHIIENLPTDLNIIVDSIFLAEGLKPENAERHLWRQVRNLVTEAADA